MSLFNQVRLTFIRYGKQVINKHGQIISEGEPEEIRTIGALQPLRLGDVSVFVPEGLKPSDVKVYYTKTLLRPANVYDNTPPDTVTIKGEEYFVSDVGDWTTNLSRLAHYKAILIRKEPNR